MNNSSGNAQVVKTFFQKLPLTLCGAFCLKKIYHYRKSVGEKSRVNNCKLEHNRWQTDKLDLFSSVCYV